MLFTCHLHSRQFSESSGVVAGYCFDDDNDREVRDRDHVERLIDPLLSTDLYQTLRAIYLPSKPALLQGLDLVVLVCLVVVSPSLPCFLFIWMSFGDSSGRQADSAVDMFENE